MSTQKKVILPARFQVCKDCGMHGHIVFSDGAVGPEAITEEDAFAQIEQARRDGKLLTVEVTLLQEQVRNSSLPTTASLILALSAALLEIEKEIEKVISDNSLSCQAGGEYSRRGYNPN